MSNWIKSLLEHPRTTLSGLGALAGAAAIGYGMSTGKVPIDSQNLAIAGGLASAGLTGVFGKDSKTSTTAPVAIDLVQQFQNMHAEANIAQEKIQAFQGVTQALTQALPPEPKL